MTRLNSLLLGALIVGLVSSQCFGGPQCKEIEMKSERVEAGIPVYGLMPSGATDRIVAVRYLSGEDGLYIGIDDLGKTTALALVQGEDGCQVRFLTSSAKNKGFDQIDQEYLVFAQNENGELVFIDQEGYIGLFLLRYYPEFPPKKQ